MKAFSSVGLATTALLLVGCMPAWDMHGHDPKEYYAKHPVKNQVEVRHVMHTLPLAMAKDEAAANLDTALADVSQAAVESVQIRLHPAQIKNEARKKALTRLFTDMGYPKRVIAFSASPEVKTSDAQIDVAYAAVISPRCPDWRGSAVTTYSNTPHSNFGCASTTNLGLQVADPRDLVKGRGDVTPDPERSQRVVRQYRSGENVGESESGSSSDGASASDLGTAISAPE